MSTVILNPDTNHVLIRLTGCRRLTNAGLPMGCFPPRPRAVVGIGLATLRPSLTAHSSAPSQTKGFQGEALAGARWEVPWAQTVVVWNEDSPCAVRAGDSPGQVCAAHGLEALADPGFPDGGLAPHLFALARQVTGPGAARASGCSGECCFVLPARGVARLRQTPRGCLACPGPPSPSLELS